VELMMPKDEFLVIDISTRYSCFRSLVARNPFRILQESPARAETNGASAIRSPRSWAQGGDLLLYLLQPIGRISARSG